MAFNSILPLLMTLMMNTFSLSQSHQDLTTLGLKIIQDGKEFAIETTEQNIKLAKEKFEITFNLKRDDDVAEKYYAARIVADIDSDIFNQFDPEKTFEEIPSLAIGTSMAGPKDAPYNCIFFDDQAHHYVFYNNEDEKRAKLLSKENGILKLGFDIENYCMQDFEINISNSNFEEIFMVFFIDKNLNEIVEEGEFVKLQITFED